MTRRSKLCYGGLLLLGVVAPAFGGEPEWVEVRSPHFSVVTDAGEKRGREVAVRFEQMRAVFGALMTKAKVTLPTPLQIVAFRNDKEMRQFVPLWRGKPTQVSGLFMGNEDRSFILLDMSVEDPWQVVFHEYAHQLLNGNMSLRTQPWFDEGFAEYFSTIKVSGKSVEIGVTPKHDGPILIQSRLMKIADLFRVSQDSSTYNEDNERRSLFYAQSWLVVHYLFDNQLFSKIYPYFELVSNQGSPIEAAIQRAFGISALQFDEALQQYLDRNQGHFVRMLTPPGIDAAEFTVKPMAMADANAVLADMHLHSVDYRERAVAEFEAILRAQPDHPAALRGLGYAYLTKQDFHRAGEYFRRAAEHDSSDPRVLYYSAFLIQQEEGPALGNDRQLLAVIQKQLERAIVLNPEFADAYSLLAFTYSSQGKNDQALATMLKAVALNPRNEGYAFNLAELYLMNREYDTAVAMLEELKKSRDPAIVAQAEQALPQAQDAMLAAAAGVPVEIRSGQETETVTAKTPGSSDTEANRGQENLGSPRHVNGDLVAVDCSAPPAAILTIVSGNQSWKLHAKDRTRVIVIGADEFSCGWAKRRVGVNYHETGAGTGEMISVELQ
jgi:tetratricopeptide (TPR) repeat protein